MPDKNNKNPKAEENELITKLQETVDRLTKNIKTLETKIELLESFQNTGDEAGELGLTAEQLSSDVAKNTAFRLEAEKKLSLDISNIKTPAPQVPKQTFKSDKVEYRFRVAKFHARLEILGAGSQEIITQDALGNQKLLDAIVANYPSMVTQVK